MATSTFIPPTFTPILQTLTSRNSIAMVGLLSYTPKTLRPLSYAQSYGFSSLLTARKLLQFQVRSVATPTEAVARFEEMLAGTHRKYYMLGSKGGVGKTSCAASLAVKFANNRHPTLVVSTDPAHSLSDSFAQDLTGGTLVPVDGPDAPLFCSGEDIFSLIPPANLAALDGQV